MFILAPLLFSNEVDKLSAWIAVLIAISCFSLWSGSIYCLNDVLDASIDRMHPRKCFRPVASGRVSPMQAIAVCLACITLGGAIAYATLPLSFLTVGCVYLISNIGYCVLLKRFVIIDVLTIAIGFVLRLLGGCTAIGVTGTTWLLLCGFSLALLLGFGKRRLEINRLAEPVKYRPVLDSYTPEKLDLLLAITSAICILSYTLYTISPQTIELHKTDKLVYTVLFVVYGIFRYLFKVHEAKSDGPVEIILKDPAFIVNSLLWLATVLVVLYFLR